MVALSLLPEIVPNEVNNNLEVATCMLTTKDVFEVLNSKQRKMLEEYPFTFIHGGSLQLDKFLQLASFSSKEQFENEYRKLYSEKGKPIYYDREEKKYYYYLDNDQKMYIDRKLVTRQEVLYLQALTKVEKSIKIGDISSKLENLSKLVSAITETEEKGLLKTFYNCDSNPIKNTNLIILACKYDQLEILNYLFSQEGSILLDNLSKDINKPSINPADVDAEDHDAFYYAIRSGNVTLLETLIEKWPGNYFNFNRDKLDKILSEAYEELKLKNVPISREISNFVEDRLVKLRFFSFFIKSSIDIKEYIKNKIFIVGSNIELLLDYEQKDIDRNFLSIARVLAKDINILKSSLKGTYNKLPWEEIEFLLSIFVSSRTKKLEGIDLFYQLMLEKDSIIEYIKTFKDGFAKISVNKIGSELPKVSDGIEISREISRREIIEEIFNSKQSPFYLSSLLSNYETIKDVYSLERIVTYIDLALQSSNQNIRKSSLLRALQVFGEYYKYTATSPHLSDETKLGIKKHIFTVEISSAIRNLISHTEDINKLDSRLKFESDENKFNGIKDDLEKVKLLLNEVLFVLKLRAFSRFTQIRGDSFNGHELYKVFQDIFTINISNDYYYKFYLDTYDKLVNLSGLLKGDEKLIFQCAGPMGNLSYMINFKKEIINVSKIRNPHLLKLIINRDFLLPRAQFFERFMKKNELSFKELKEAMFTIVGESVSKFGREDAEKKIMPAVKDLVSGTIDKSEGRITNIESMIAYLKQEQEMNYLPVLSELNKSDDDIFCYTVLNRIFKCKLAKNDYNYKIASKPLIENLDNLSNDLVKFLSNFKKKGVQRLINKLNQNFDNIEKDPDSDVIGKLGLPNLLNDIKTLFGGHFNPDSIDKSAKLQIRNSIGMIKKILLVTKLERLRELDRQKNEIEKHLQSYSSGSGEGFYDQFYEKTSKLKKLINPKYKSSSSSEISSKLDNTINIARSGDWEKVRGEITDLFSTLDHYSKLIRAIDQYGYKFYNYINDDVVEYLSSDDSNQLQDILKKEYSLTYLKNFVNDKINALKQTLKDYDDTNCNKSKTLYHPAIESLLLDIMDALKELEVFQRKPLFLDQTLPVLVQLPLRNYLAHGGLLMEILLFDISEVIISNARMTVDRGKLIVPSQELIKNAEMKDYLIKLHSISNLDCNSLPDRLKNNHSKQLIEELKESSCWKDYLSDLLHSSQLPFNHHDHNNIFNVQKEMFNLVTENHDD